MSAIAAVFFDGHSSRAHPVQVSADAGALAIRAGDWQRNELLSGVRVTPRVAGIHRTLLLRDGSQLQVEDNDAVDAWFPSRDRAASWIDRLERHAVAVAASLVITVAGVFVGIVYGIPKAAEKIAAHIPDTVARQMGEQTVTLLDRFGFDKSDLPQKRRDELQAVFTKYVADLPDPKHYQLRFMGAKMANAFALPGGIIVVTDEMVRLVDGNGVAAGGTGGERPYVGQCKRTEVEHEDAKPGDKSQGSAEGERKIGASDESNTDGKIASVAVKTPDADDDSDEETDEDASATKDKPSEEVTADPVADLAKDERFLAVIAHEIGHEEHQHVLRSVLQSSGIVLVGVYFTGDVSSASALVVSVPTFLLDSHYSRGFEAEADEYAFASLAAHHISPARFAEVMQAMQKAEPGFRHESGYLSTHPRTLERILSAQQAAMKFQSGQGEQNK